MLVFFHDMDFLIGSSWDGENAEILSDFREREKKDGWG